MLLQNPAPFSLYLTPMALLPSHYSLYSFSRLQFLRHNSTKTLHPFKTSISNPNNSSSNSWLQNWNPTHFRPLPKKPKSVLDYRNAVSDDDEELIGTSRSTGSSTMAKIVEKLKKFGYIEDSEEGKGERRSPLPEKGSVEDIFYAEDGILPDSRGGLSLNLEEEVRFPWEKNPGGGEEERRKKRSKTSVAELTLPEGELRRLRHMAIRCKSKTRIKGAGVTQEIVDLIHDKWRSEEVVRLKCEGPAALNMRRIHEILERKTGGLVIWRSGSSISLYRGVSYETAQPEKKPYRSVKMSEVGSFDKTTNSPSGFSKNDSGTMQYSREDRPAPIEKIKDTESPPEVNYESEVDKLLDSIGPRYTDWPGSGPLPVDADLLPAIIPDYKPPFRILPYGVRPSLGYNEATSLRRLARVLPPHFALGRSRQHEGLAAAMLKLWERSSIAKIGLKRGVQLTTSERMAEDIKRLTGCTILSRNKDFLVFYRGKDFLSPEVTEALLERERLAKALQDEEEQARQRASFSVGSMIESIVEPSNAGTLGETLQADARWGNKLNDDHKNNMMRAAEVARHAGLVRKLERKLYIAERKLTKAERALAKVEVFLKPITPTPDPDSITDEERFMFRKLGLRMKAFLLLGRRGVFDGTVENMHLHWKYRELVRVLVKAKNFAQVRSVALALEAESGGTLVSVDKVSKGFAIIVYRGKDYHRPPTLRPKNLLTKRKALARSIELQRHEALKHHISKINRSVEKLKSELGQMEDVKDQGNEDLYAKLDSAYEEEEAEEEDDNDNDESYLKTLDCGADSSHEQDGEADSYDDDDSEADNYFDDDDDDTDNDDDYSLEDGVLGEFEEEDDASSRSSKNACYNKYSREDTEPESSSHLFI